MLTPHAIAQITAYLDVRAEVKAKADIAFVFGTRSRRPARRAAWLFKRGFVDYIVCTGGVNRVTGKREAKTHSNILLAYGVPPEKIIIENQSTNTSENVTFGLRAIQNCNHLDLTKIQSVVAVAKWYHARRGLMTLKRHFPKGIHYYVSAYTPIHAYRQNWWLSELGHQSVMKEWLVIPEYLKRGWISEIHSEGDFFV